MQTLDRLIHPYPLAEFLTNSWTRRGVFLPGEPDKFRHLFSWGQLNHLLNFHNYSYPNLRFAVEGKVLPKCNAQDWVKHCQEGATLILNHVHQRLPVLAELTASLTEEIGHSSQVNTYCSWPSQQGFNCHYDTHEVFIVQIEGRKQWFVFEETIAYPCKNAKSLGLEPPEASPYLQCILNPGDALYIPRGHWHYAIALDEPSLHLTLGITCRTGIDWLNWLVKQLQCQSDWRQSLPLASDGDPGQLEHHLYSLLENLMTTLKEEKLVHKYVQSCLLSGRTPELSLPSQAGYGIFEQGFETRFRRPKFQQLRVDAKDQNCYQIATASKQVDITGMTPEFIDNLIGGKAFTVWDAMEWLPDFDLEADVLPLLLRLVKEGLLLVD